MREIIYPKETVKSIKKMFPHNTELAIALDTNSVEAFDIISDLAGTLNSNFISLAMCGYPGSDYSSG